MSVIKSIELVSTPEGNGFFWRIVDGGLIYTYFNVNDALRYMQFHGETEVSLEFVDKGSRVLITKADLKGKLIKPSENEKR